MYVCILIYNLFCTDRNKMMTEKRQNCGVYMLTRRLALLMLLDESGLVRMVYNWFANTLVIFIICHSIYCRSPSRFFFACPVSDFEYRLIWRCYWGITAKACWTWLGFNESIRDGWWC